MFFALAPERAGCNAKISFAETQQFQERMFGLDCGRSDFSTCDLREGHQLVSSIDKLGRFCVDLTLFADVALCHAIRDVNAGFGRPLIVDLCFEFGGDLPTFEDRLSLVDATRESCRRYGVQVGKCHSVFAALTALTVAVIGQRPLVQRGIISSAGAVILSDRLGGFKEIYLQEQGHPRASSVAATMGMQFDYSPHVDRLRAKAMDMADVSGFGLGGTLSSVARRNRVDLFVEVETSVFWSNEIDVVSCLQSDAPDGVFSDSEDLLVALSQREVSGPLVILSETDSDYLFKYLDGLGLNPSIIGKYVGGSGKVSATWR